MMGRRRWAALAAVMIVSGGAAQALGQPSSAEDALAETLYRQGRQLMADGRFGEACSKFAESQRLDPASGTLLNLAACHEAEHMFAAAWVEYTEATAWARRDQREDRVVYAQERIRALEPKLSHLTVVVNAEADIPELHVEVDGVLFRDAARGVPIPVDPGTHRVDARAPGRKPWWQLVKIAESPTNVTITIPALEPPQERPPPSVTVAPAATAPGELEGRPRPIPPSVYVAGGFTIGAAFGASATGIWFLTKKSHYESTGDDADFRAAKTAGLVNVGFWVATALGAGTTAYFYLSRPPEQQRNQAEPTAAPKPLSLDPWVDGSSYGMIVRWRQ
jgi:hypothetical protein